METAVAELPEDGNKCSGTQHRAEKKCGNEVTFYSNAAIAVPPVAKENLPALSFKSISHDCVK